MPAQTRNVGESTAAFATALRAGLGHAQTFDTLSPIGNPQQLLKVPDYRSCCRCKRVGVVVVPACGSSTYHQQRANSRNFEFAFQVFIPDGIPKGRNR
jgi:hypothetical protein